MGSRAGGRRIQRAARCPAARAQPGAASNAAVSAGSPGSTASGCRSLAATCAAVAMPVSSSTLAMPARCAPRMSVSSRFIAIAVVVAVVGPDHPNLKPGIGNPTRQLGFVDIASPDSSTHWDLGCSSWRHNSTALHSIGLVADIVLVNIMRFGFHFA